MQSNPTFLCALDNSGGVSFDTCPSSYGGWHQPTCDDYYAAAYSALPPGLTEGMDALAWTHWDNWAYAGTAAGTVSELMVAIADRVSWTSSNSDLQTFQTSFVVHSEPPRLPPPPSPAEPPVGLPGNPPPPPMPPPPPPMPPPTPMPPPPPPVPPLSAGDCMVIGFHSDSPDHFAILLLAPLGPGQTISATDDGWSTAYTPNAFANHNVELHVSHTAVVDEPAGTVLTIADFSGTLQLHTLSDQLLVYQGAKSSPTFLCALDNSGGFTRANCYDSSGEDSSGGWHQASCQDQDDLKYYSALPPDLTDGVNALAWPHRDNWAYTGPTTGSASELRAAIAQNETWTWSSTPHASLRFTRSFTVHPHPPPPLPPPLPPVSPHPPLPPPDPPVSPPSTPATPPWATVTGPCVLDNYCVQSSGYPTADYGRDEMCVVTGLPAIPAQVMAFEVEFHGVCLYDRLTMNGAHYCGQSGPSGVTPLDGSITWTSDSSAS
eukprot:2050492-Prymnesium_polylepis.3